MSETTERVRLFSNGTQYMDWTCNNCDRCAKQAEPDSSLDEVACEIERAMIWALLDDGTVDEGIAKRCGYDPDAYSWPCPERDPPWAKCQVCGALARRDSTDGKTCGKAECEQGYAGG